MSVPPRKHAGGHARAPPGVLAWVGGGGLALRARGTPIYILFYILSFISQIPVTYIGGDEREQAQWFRVEQINQL